LDTGALLDFLDENSCRNIFGGHDDSAGEVNGWRNTGGEQQE
jgi:hypothetical protein